MASRLMLATPELVCPVAEAIGARSITVVEFYGARPDLDEAAEAFAGACDIAARHGVLLSLEFLPWAGIPDLSMAWEIVRRADRPNGGLLVDSWHFFRSGSTFAQLEVIPGEKVLYIQLDDAPAVGEVDMAEETMHRRSLPGSGEFELVRLIEVLDAIGC